MDELKAILNDDGVFEEYDDTYDLTIHCTSQEDQDKTIKILQERTWITDRDPTPEECEAVSATGFIICISGTIENVIYNRAIDMQDNWYEDGRWYLHGAHPNKTKGLQGDEHEVFKVHGWMLPPSWDIEED